MKTWFDSLRVNHRFALISLTVLVLVISLVGVNFWGSTQFNSFIQTTEEDQIPEILSINKAVEQIQEAEANLYAALLSNNPSHIQALLANTRNGVKVAQEKLDTYTLGVHPDSEKELTERLKTEIQDWSAEMQVLINFAQANTPESDKEATTLLEQDHHQALLKDLAEVVTINQNEASEVKEQSAQNFLTINIITIGFALAVLVVIFTVLWVLSRSIIRMTDDIKRLNDEASKALSENNRQFGESASVRLKAIISQLSTTTYQQATLSQQQTSSVVEVTTSLNELGETSRQIAMNSQQVNSSAKETLESATSVGESARLAAQNAERGQAAVRSSIKAIEDVRDGITNLAQRLLALTERSKQISSIIDLIAGIADETHLLALNAAIESAGAGESGRRFAVIANEVKSLADRSLEATGEVREVIGELQATVAAAVLASEETRKRTFGAVERSVQAGQAITDLGQTVEHSALNAAQIEEMIKEVTLRAEEISLATQQQESAVRQIISTMQGVEMVARENATSVSQINSTVGQIDEISDQIKEALSKTEVALLAA